MKHSFLLFVIFLDLISYGCQRPDEMPFSFVLTPGDASATVTRLQSSCPDYNDSDRRPIFIMDMQLLPEGYGDYEVIKGKNHSFIWPSESVWQNYTEPLTVKEHYYELAFAIESLLDRETPGEWYSTVFASGPIKIIADKEFEGYPSGKDLSELFSIDPIVESGATIETLNPADVVSFKETLKNKCFSYFKAKVRGPLEFQQPVTFTFTIPARRFLLLKWINDRVTNTNTDMIFVDDELSWNVTIGKYTTDKTGVVTYTSR